MKKYLQKYLPILIGKQLKIQSLLNEKRATERAFNIFCTPRKGRIQEHEKDFLATAKSEKIITNDHKIQTYHWEGTGETIILLHGWESNSFRWKNLIQLLQQKKYNIIAIDAPAQGYSSGKYLNVPLYTNCTKDIIEKWKPSILIGHSLGAMTAIYYNYLYRKTNIQKTICLGPPSELSLFMKGFQNTLQLSDSFMSKLDKYLKKKFGFFAREFSISKFAKELKSPGLLILEKEDKLAPYKLSKKIADSWNNCELFTVTNTGHSLQSTEINNKILDYLKQSS